MWAVSSRVAATQGQMLLLLRGGCKLEGQPEILRGQEIPASCHWGWNRDGESCSSPEVVRQASALAQRSTKWTWPRCQVYTQASKRRATESPQTGKFRECPRAELKRRNTRDGSMEVREVLTGRRKCWGLPTDFHYLALGREVWFSHQTAIQTAKHSSQFPLGKLIARYNWTALRRNSSFPEEQVFYLKDQALQPRSLGWGASLRGFFDSWQRASQPEHQPELKLCG